MSSAGFGSQANAQDDDSDEEADRPKSCAKYAIKWILGIVNSTLKCLGGRSTFKLNSIFELATRASVSTFSLITSVQLINNLFNYHHHHHQYYLFHSVS